MSTFQNLARDGVARYASVFQKNGCVLVFHHIPKTAGSSLTREMAQTMAPYRNIFIRQGATLGLTQDGRTRADALAAEIDAFIEEHKTRRYASASGHFRQKELKTITEAVPNAKVFTFLRDPAARLISDYRYAKTPRHPPHEEFSRKYPTIEVYLEDPANQNKMWRFVRPRNMPPDATALEQAFRRYAFFGLVADFALHFEFLSGLITCPRRPQAQLNVTGDQLNNTVELSGPLKARIAALNAEDYTLYAAVETALAARRAEMVEFVAARRAFFGAA